MSYRIPAVSLPNSLKLSVDLKVTNEESFETAKKLLDQVRPGHWFGDRALTLCVVGSLGDAKILAAAWAKIDIPTGLDLETSGNWAPKVLRPTGTYLDSGEPIVKKVPIHVHHSEHRPKPQIMQISWGGEAYIIPAEYLHIFKDVVKNICKMDLANAEFEYNVLRDNGIPWDRFHRDTVQMAFCAFDKTVPHSLKYQSQSYLGIDLNKFDTEFTKVYDKLSETEFLFSEWDEVELSAVVYAALDPWITTLVADCLEDTLRRRKCIPHDYNGADLYFWLERPFQMSCIRAFRWGVPFRRDVSQQMAMSLKHEADLLEGRALKLAGRKLNFNSPTNMSSFFYISQNRVPALSSDGFYCAAKHGKLQRTKQLSSATNNACTEHGTKFRMNKLRVDDTVLGLIHAEEEAAGRTAHKKGCGCEGGSCPVNLNNNIADLIIKFKNRSKIRSSFVVPYLHTEDKAHCVVYPDITTHGVTSGRLAGKKLLTTPAVFRDQLGLPEESPYDLFSIDEGQVEIRILAEVTGDPIMLKALWEGRDMHCQTGAILEAFFCDDDYTNEEITDKYYKRLYLAKVKTEKDDVWESYVNSSGYSGPRQLNEKDKHLLARRKVAKSVVFGIIYGMGAGKLVQEFGISLQEAEKIFEIVMTGYPKLGETFAYLIKDAKQRKHMFTLIGRFKDLTKNFGPGAVSALISAGERLVKNQHCQAGAADVMRGAQFQVDLDMEVGGLYGTEGRMAYGTWENGEYIVEQDLMPPKWRDNLPKAIAADLGLLGRRGCQLLLQVHDELILQVLSKHTKECADRIQAIMEDPFGDWYKFSVPLVSSVSVGKNFKQIK